MSNDWVNALLGTLGAPDTASNRSLLSAWQRYEGGHTNNSASYNWLNTTLGKDYPAINSVGVRAYPDFQTGISHIADTLTSGYPTIVGLLRKGVGSDVVRSPEGMGDLNYWLSGRRVQQATPYVQKIASALGLPALQGGPTAPVASSPATVPSVQAQAPQNNMSMALLALLGDDSKITPWEQLIQ